MSARSRRRLRRTSRKRNPFLLVLLVLAACLALGAMSFGLWVLSVAAEAPPIAQLQPVDVGENSVIYAADGSRLGYIQSDTARTPVDLDRIPDDLQKATVAIEDSRFYDHHGIDLEGVIRAAVNNVEAGRTVGGRLDDHDAARPQPLHHRPPAGPRAEDQGGEDRRGAGGRPLQGVDPRSVPEHGLVRDRERAHRGGGRGGFEDLLLEVGQRPRPGAVGAARRHPAVAVALQPASEPARRPRSPQRRPGPHGRAGLHLRR